MDSSSYSVWNNFFLLAGIPHTVANEYANTFSQHRIRIDMLKEITKEILLDMGIKAMGDIIAILRHAKNLYTQDELKVGTNATSTGVTNNIITPRQTIVNQLNQRTPITTSRPGPSISSLVGNKIQSRVSMNSGAIIASSNNTNSHVSLSKNKRTASTISNSLSKRLCPATDIGHLNERTLTVHYPPKSAIAKAQQRISGTSSVKARLGTNPSISPSNPNNYKQKNWPRKTNGNATRSSLTNSSARVSDERRSERVISQPPRLKSTVFNRLGDGAR